MAIQSSNSVLFSINQDEQAKQTDARYLLAQDVYQKIVDLLARSLKKVNSLQNSVDIDDLDAHRAHEAILLDGGRGTGKSAILVNLTLYVEDRTAFDKDLLILKPIDPTLLENGENMFLDVFIAALVRDKHVKARLDTGGREAEAFYDQLSKLGSALESAHAQHEDHGMDRVRALIGSSGIADQVHRLFQSTLKLTGKKLIVLPIDDVDTALHHAYEKIEIVRKYLVSPYLIPLISGDIALYDDVIWRNIHGRLLLQSEAENDAARARAKDLSIAYQRKLLPLPRRIAVPELSDYLRTNEMKLSENGKEIMSFPVFKSWLEAVLNERVNGVENSFLALPIKTVREFAQLVFHVQTLLPDLGTKLANGADVSLTGLQRLIFMKPAVVPVINGFAEEYIAIREIATKSGRSTALGKAYKTLQENIGKLPVPDALDDSSLKIVIAWQRALRTYFKHHHDGGPTYLMLKANEYLRRCADDQPKNRLQIFETDLFRPHQHQKYISFSKSKDINDEWKAHLQTRIPGVWVKNLPESSILPYPKPEIGSRIKNSEKALKKGYFGDIKNPDDVELVRRLMTHFNFYNATNRSALALTGRIYELLITSLIKDIRATDVIDLIDRAPFFSAAAMASTKNFDVASEDEFEEGNDHNDNDVTWDTLTSLVDEINSWRAANKADLSSPPHSWLLYNVTNKYFNQANFFNTSKSGIIAEVDVSGIFGIALQAFNAIWAIFGSFEKGEIFGFDTIIATMNIGKDSDFEKNQLYLQNIKPFLQKKSSEKDGEPEVKDTSFVNFRTGAYTYLLASHPLRKLLREVNAVFPKKLKNTSSNSPFSTKGAMGAASASSIIIASDENEVSFNRLLRSVARAIENITYTAPYINNASLEDLHVLKDSLRDELMRNNKSWGPYFDNALSFSPWSKTSSLGKLQSILNRIRDETVDAQGHESVTPDPAES
jgi:hypothetical protein